jgi:hypothetical protein
MSANSREGKHKRGDIKNRLKLTRQHHMRGDGKGSAGCGEQQRGTPSTKGKLLKCRNQTSEKTGAGPVITVFLLFCCCFMQLGIPTLEEATPTTNKTNTLVKHGNLPSRTRRVSHNVLITEIVL